MKERGALFIAEMVRALLDGRKTKTRRIVKLKHGVTIWHPQVIEVGDSAWIYDEGTPIIKCPYGKKGGRLWVRETFFVYNDWQYIYRADNDDKKPMPGAGWTPSIFMPRVASRIDLEIVADIQVEKVQDISEEDAKAEGRGMPTEDDRCEKYVENPDYLLCSRCGGSGLYDGLAANLGVIPDMDCRECDTYKGLFKNLWDSINAKPKPVYKRGSGGKKFISHYESYPWEDAGTHTLTHRGKPWYIYGNPWVFAIEFKVI